MSLVAADGFLRVRVCFTNLMVSKSPNIVPWVQNGSGYLLIGTSP
jgi:hypothetical protein